MSREQREQRAVERRKRAWIRKTTLQACEADPSDVRGAAAISLVWALTREGWALSGTPMPSYRRDETPYRFVARRSV
jgi:hypothetical protein